MAIVIAIFGPHGVGKTSLQMFAKKNNVKIREGFEFPNNIDDCSTWEKFWEYQMRYWDMVKKQLNEIRKEEGVFIISRSYEEQLYYLSAHPLSVGHENVIKEFAIGNLAYKSDYLFYLDASFDVLKERINNDSLREPQETRWWYRDRYYLYDKLNKSHKNIHVIDTSEISTQQVFTKIMEIVAR